MKTTNFSLLSEHRIKKVVLLSWTLPGLTILQDKGIHFVLLTLEKKSLLKIVACPDISAIVHDLYYTDAHNPSNLLLVI